MGSHLGEAICPWEVGFRDAPSVVFQLCSLRGTAVPQPAAVPFLTLE